jgi:hypothetical protein
VRGAFTMPFGADVAAFVPAQRSAGNRRGINSAEMLLLREKDRFEVGQP